MWVFVYRQRRPATVPRPVTTVSVAATIVAKINTNILNFLNLAGVLGFEPRQTVLEAVVLPLHYTPSLCLKIENFVRQIQYVR